MMRVPTLGVEVSNVLNINKIRSFDSKMDFCYTSPKQLNRIQENSIAFKNNVEAQMKDNINTNCKIVQKVR